VATDYPFTNQRRLFSDVVSVDGWSIKGDDASQVCVDVAFRTSAMGGEPESDVRFRLSLKRAELVAIIPPLEPLSIMKDTVARDRSATVTQIIKRDAEASGRQDAAAVGATLTDSIPRVSANARITSDRRSEQSNTKEQTIEAGPIMVDCSLTPEGNYRWEMTPAMGTLLKGSGWDPQNPRFSVKSSSRLGGSIRFQIRCLREDIEITDISFKKKLAIYDPRTIGRNKMAAVESYIRSKLTETGLIEGDITDPFSDICLLELSVDV